MPVAQDPPHFVTGPISVKIFSKINDPINIWPIFITLLSSAYQIRLVYLKISAQKFVFKYWSKISAKNQYQRVWYSDEVCFWSLKERYLDLYGMCANGFKKIRLNKALGNIHGHIIEKFGPEKRSGYFHHSFTHYCPAIRKIGMSPTNTWLAPPYLLREFGYLRYY